MQVDAQTIALGVQTLAFAFWAGRLSKRVDGHGKALEALQRDMRETRDAVIAQGVLKPKGATSGV